jgi:hypothetical protein
LRRLDDLERMLECQEIGRKITGEQGRAERGTEGTLFPGLMSRVGQDIAIRRHICGGVIDVTGMSRVLTLRSVSPCVVGADAVAARGEPGKHLAGKTCMADDHRPALADRRRHESGGNQRAKQESAESEQEQGSAADRELTTQAPAC